MRHALSVLLILISATTAVALGQDQAVGISVPGRLGMPFAATPVAGHPYSGEQVTEFIQTLADGTHINQTTLEEKIYRDSQGRTRRERPLIRQPNVQDGPMIIDVLDPAAHVRYSWSTQDKTAHRGEFGQTNGSFAGMIPPPPPPPPPPPSGANVTPRGDPAHPRYLVKTEKLEPQTMEGVPVEGRRTTLTYPVGAIGNDREFASTTELWTSPDLKVIVLMKSNDPRSGERTTKLIHISRDEPDPSLFQPPAGYAITDEQAAPGIVFSPQVQSHK